MPANAVNRLLAHYRRTARDLPWRIPPGSNRKPDPYHVWLSEVMLQQTTVATVTPRFARFLEEWPKIGDLAAASQDEVLAEWAGLGYYARARNLHACAQQVATMGDFPDTEEKLAQLPGLGPYTAAAIAAIAFGRDSVPIDTNVERVVARLEGIEDRNKIRAAAHEIWPKGRAGEFAQAMMDLGATICRPKNPLCDQCPLQPECVAFATGDPQRFPAPKQKKQRPERHGAAWWIERDGAIWLVRRPDNGLLGGMAALPGSDWHEGPPPSPSRNDIRHVFTHFALTLTIERRPSPPPGQGWWQPLDRLGEVGLPTLYAKAAALMLQPA